VLRLRPSRARARRLAVEEAVSLLRPFDAAALAGGPFGSEPRVAWVSVSSSVLDDAVELLPLLGYTVAVDLGDGTRLYEEDAAALRESAVDRRTFAITTRDGVREVRGYRGDGSDGAKRGLAVPDARLLANLVRADGLLLDPFAGVGGIVREWPASVSVDIDRVVAPGLAALGPHLLASAATLPLRDGCVAGVATEPPFDDSSDATVAAALTECLRVVRPGGRIAMMAPARQVRALRRVARPALEEPVDRKGLPVVVAVWEA
jgi:SAM-dependent methyltransferase